MAYIPRAPEPAICQNCGKNYLSNHLRRRYCSNSCNVLATQRRKQAGSTVSRPVTARESFEIPERLRVALGSVTAGGREPFYITVDKSAADEKGRTLMVVQYHSSERFLRWLDIDGKTAQGLGFYVGSDGSIWLKDMTKYFQVQTVDTESMMRIRKESADAYKRSIEEYRI